MKKKMIAVKSEDNYISFIRKLNLYKSLLYLNTEFQLNEQTNNSKVLQIIKGLNIKNRRKRITYVYNTACNIIDNNTKGLNICGFKKNKCYIQQIKNNGKCNGCCRLCKYQNSNGCPTKNLACKLFNCSEVKKRYKTIEYKDLDILRLLSLKNRLIVKSDYFSTREDVLKDLYAFTLTYSILRVISRNIRNFISTTKNSNQDSINT